MRPGGRSRPPTAPGRTCSTRHRPPQDGSLRSLPPHSDSPYDRHFVAGRRRWPGAIDAPGFVPHPGPPGAVGGTSVLCPAERTERGQRRDVPVGAGDRPPGIAVRVGGQISFADR